MSTFADPASGASGARILTASAIYFAIVFAVGLILGPIRVLWIEPWLGATLAVLCEAPLLAMAMALAARLAPRLAGLGGGWAARLTMGALALAMQQIADLSVGFGLRGLTLQAQLAYFQTPPGYIYIATLVLFAVMPLLVYWRSARRLAAPTQAP